MLQTIREHTQGWIAGIIISLIILSFALWGIHSYFTGGGGMNTVASVNGVDLTKDQLTTAYERLRRQAQSQYGMPVTSKDEAVLKDRALKALIEVEVLKQASLRQGFRISSQQIDHYLQSMPEFQVNGQFSIERFQEILSSTLLSTSEFLDLVRTSLLIEQPKLGIVFTSFALPDETAYTISLVNQERNIDYINLPWSFFLSQPIHIGADQIKAYYEAHQVDFMTPEQVSVEYVQLSPKELLTKFNPTEAALKNFYDENINSYTQPTAWKLADVVVPVTATANPNEIAQAELKAKEVAARLRKGEDISTVQASFATDHMSKQGVIVLNQVPAELQKSVSTLSTLNAVSEPVRTDKGWVVLKVIEYREPKMQAYAAVKDKVREAYVRQHAEETFSDMRDRLADLTYQHPESLQVAAKTLGLPIHTSELFTKDKVGKDIAQYKKVRDMAFSNDVVNLQNNSDVIQLNSETVVVLRIKSHIPSSLLPLNDVTQQIEGKLKNREAEKRAALFTTEILTQLRAGVSLDKIAADHHLSWTKAGYIGRYSSKVDSAIVETAFSMPQPNTEQNKPTFGRARLPGGYALIALMAVKPGMATDNKQTAVFAEQVQNSEGLLEYELYKQSQLTKSKIDLHS